MECLRKYVCISKNVLAFAYEKDIAFLPSFWCVCATCRGNQNPAGDAFELEKGKGDVRDYNIPTAAIVLYDTSTRCTYYIQSRASRSR